MTNSLLLWKVLTGWCTFTVWLWHQTTLSHLAFWAICTMPPVVPDEHPMWQWWTFQLCAQLHLPKQRTHNQNITKNKKQNKTHKYTKRLTAATLHCLRWAGASLLNGQVPEDGGFKDRDQQQFHLKTQQRDSQILRWGFVSVARTSRTVK